MLSVDTKRKIDSARDVLVGKIPNPQAQVEQITTALIYKFMDDMDEKSKTLGGKARFFVGEYEKYSWRKILDPRIGGQERMNLYSDAVTKLSQNSALPQIFRDVFKDAFVPYRDPETLSLFLKEINWFDYHHSEELGNAYEYLLSVMGSQGDAGQFRTPRHIIDFIVEAVDPQKNETILDPACGTAGFLISAYKHILKSNDGLDDITGLPTDKEAILNPEDRAKMLKNFTGYDISPEMVRLSLVNMYLHGFVQPRTEEYDSLTYEDHWNEDFDVILANPPFMTPKGGVRPHKKFQIQANRAEILFVDYIAEHIKPNGRAGIVVPEGITASSGNVYNSLRKMLVEDNYLWAVVSLPAGVFLPYSGVKTSILLLDKARAKQNHEILFIDIKGDGFSLNSQRNPVSQNDFPEAINVINSWRHNQVIESNLASWVPKDKIRSTKDYDLTGSRHKKHKKSTSEYPIVELGDITRLVRGVVYSKKDEVDSGGYKVLRANNIAQKTGYLNLIDVKQINRNITFKDEKKLKRNDIFICLASGSKDHIGKVAFVDDDTEYYFGGFMGAVRVLDESQLSPKYLFNILRSHFFNDYLREQIAGANINNLNSKIYSNFKIPLPPINKQLELIQELDSRQKKIEEKEFEIIQEKKLIDTKIAEVWGE